MQCEHDEQPQYAGLCYLAVARCEAALNNPCGEAWAQVKAGRQFLQAHIQTEDGGLISPGGELLEVSLGFLSPFLCLILQCLTVMTEYKIVVNAYLLLRLDGGESHNSCWSKTSYITLKLHSVPLWT